jgi:hypothetical protein
MELCWRVVFRLLMIWGLTLNVVFGSRAGGWIMDRLEGYRVGH